MSCSVVCVLRGGGEYTPEHVRRLYQGVKKHWPAGERLRFVALTDEAIGVAGIEERSLYKPWTGWWSKMELFLPRHDSLGDILYFDLDTIIVGSLATISAPKPMTLLNDFCRQRRLQSGMMYLPKNDRALVEAAFFQDAPNIMATVRGDGEFLHGLFYPSVCTWQQLMPDQILSYKAHVRQNRGQTVPDGASVVCFHGRPRPWDTPLWERYAC